MAQPLKDAGLNRVTVSMDAVDPDRFTRITRVPNGFDNVLAGIRAARRAARYGESELRADASALIKSDYSVRNVSREEDVIVRFIEFMPLGEGRTWTPSTVVTLDEILARMAGVPANSRNPGRPGARRRRGDGTASRME